MMEIAESVLQSKLFWSTTFVLGIYLYLKLVIFNYWKKKGVPHEHPIVPVGNILPVTLGKKCTGKVNYDFFNSFTKISFRS